MLNPVGQTGTWELKFSDEFEGTTLNRNNWNPNFLGVPGTITKPANDYELAAYDPAQVRVADGYLQLTAIRSPVIAADGKTYQYRSGMVESANKVEFTSGYFEARIYMPDDGNGKLYNWGAFWLNGHHKSWPDRGEIDIMENLETGLGWAYHGPSMDVGRTPVMDQKGWHTYAAHWTPNNVKFYYDGIAVGEVKTGVLNYPSYMLLNYALSPKYSGPLAADKTMLVDYVRVWDKVSDSTPPSSAPAPVNNPYKAVADHYNATEDQVLTVKAASGVLANDVALDGGKVATAGTFATAKGGSVKIAADGSFVYTPKPDFFGTDSFKYTARDVNGDTGQGTVTISVADVPEPLTPSKPAPAPAPTPAPAVISKGITKNGGSSADRLTGTKYADTINGKGGNDIIFGKGGNDILTGGAGSDTFVFDTALGSKNVDKITDFNPKYDTIRLENNVFKKLKYTGKIKSAHFEVHKPDDSNDHIWYNRSTGKLYYDPDGNGKQPSVHFATLTNKPLLTASDFYII